MAENDYPLLVLPEPMYNFTKTTYNKRSRRPYHPQYTLPGVSRQGERLASDFNRLQDSSLGSQHEQVLVFEIIGTVQAFTKAIEELEGLECLGVHWLYNIPPGHGFKNKKDPNKELIGQLFLVLADQQALQELRNLFNRWTNDPNHSLRSGLASLKTTFKYLRSIRLWNLNDRFYNTGILDDWKHRLNHKHLEFPF